MNGIGLAILLFAAQTEPCLPVIFNDLVMDGPAIVRQFGPIDSTFVYVDGKPFGMIFYEECTDQGWEIQAEFTEPFEDGRMIIDLRSLPIVADGFES